MTPDDHDQIWDYVEACESYASIGKMIGRRLSTMRDDVNKHPRLTAARAEASIGQATVGQ